MPLDIETDTTSYYWTQRVPLEGTTYAFSFRYNSREQVYYLQIATLDGTVQVGGIKLVSNWPLLQSCNNPNAPPGELVAAATASDTPAAFGELSTSGRVTLRYYSLAEVSAGGSEPWRFPGFLT